MMNSLRRNDPLFYQVDQTTGLSRKLNQGPLTRTVIEDIANIDRRIDRRNYGRLAPVPTKPYTSVRLAVCHIRFQVGYLLDRNSVSDT